MSQLARVQRETASVALPRWAALGVVLAAVLGSVPAFGQGTRHFLYFENNDPTAGQNAVFGYSRNPVDGSLTPLLGNPFFTGGTGFLNTDQRLGPDDTDQEVAVSPDGRFLFAVNEGSDDISVFRIMPDGSLVPIPGSPFASGGKEPCSLQVVGGTRLYVVNRGDGTLPTTVNPAGAVGTPGATNYTAFDIAPNGSLTQLSASTIVLADGTSPSQIIASASGQFLFGNDFFTPDATVVPPAPIFPKARSILESFTLDPNNGFRLTPGTLAQLPVAFNAAPYLLGLQRHPTEAILYAGAVAVGQLSVWQYDANGVLSFYGLDNLNGKGAAGGLCWVAIDQAAQYVYGSDVGTDQISVFSIADPLAPVRLQNFNLGGPKGPLIAQPEPYQFTTAPFNLVVDPLGRFLYVLSAQTCITPAVDPVNCPLGNALHILAIADDGTVSETPGSPIILPGSIIPDHGKGLVLVSLGPTGAPLLSGWMLVFAIAMLGGVFSFGLYRVRRTASA